MLNLVDRHRRAVHVYWRRFWVRFRFFAGPSLYGCRRLHYRMCVFMYVFGRHKARRENHGTREVLLLEVEPTYCKMPPLA